MASDIKKKMTIESKDFIRMVQLGVDCLNLHIEEVNELNVFPVPDGDTGTNMKRTIATGYDVISGLDVNEPLYKVGQALSKGMLLGARGNSGVILSQIFRGFSNGLGLKKFVSTVGLAYAFKSAVKQAYSAVVKPVEGTILTVLREAVNYANKNQTVSVYQYLKNLLKQARITLKNTKEMLDVLKEADVIDSGGAGLVYIFEGFVSYFEGGKVKTNIALSEVAPTIAGETPMDTSSLDFSLFNENSVLDYGYCTEFLLQLSASKVDVSTFDVQDVITYLESVGDSVVCFKDGTIVKAHVHTKDPGAVLSYVRKWGEFLTMKVENMSLQHNNKVAKEEKLGRLQIPKKKVHKQVASVAVASGSGIVKAFQDLGVDEIVSGQQTMNPSSEDFLKAFDNIDADNIVVLPNNSNIVLTAEQAKEMYKEQKPEVNVVVIKTKSIAQGYVAASVLQFPGTDIESIVSDVELSISDVYALEITKATRNTVVSGVKVTKDHMIGILNHELVADSRMTADCALKALEKIEDIKDREMMLIMFGADLSDKKDQDKFLNKIKSKYPNLELSVIDGKQEVYPVIASIC